MSRSSLALTEKQNEHPPVQFIQKMSLNVCFSFYHVFKAIEQIRKNFRLKKHYWICAKIANFKYCGNMFNNATLLALYDQTCNGKCNPQIEFEGNFNYVHILIQFLYFVLKVSIVISKLPYTLIFIYDNTQQCIMGPATLWCTGIGHRSWCDQTRLETAAIWIRSLCILSTFILTFSFIHHLAHVQCSVIGSTIMMSLNVKPQTRKCSIRLPHDLDLATRCNVQMEEGLPQWVCSNRAHVEVNHSGACSKCVVKGWTI